LLLFEAEAFALGFLAVALFAGGLVALALPAARFAAHRFFSAATMFRLPVADNFRFGFLVSGAGVDSDSALFAAHRFFCASAIARLAAALIVCLRVAGSAEVDPPSALLPSSRAELGDLLVKLLPLRSKVLERSIQNLSCELLCHVGRAFY
jgi:hypothetical protein